MGRELSERSIDSLLAEMVSLYCNRFYANKPELAAPRSLDRSHQLSGRPPALRTVPYLFHFHFRFNLQILLFV
uniref:Trafficking protein particle complex subunit 6B n=1 Tax=Rhizophora mucronata TaxID=61149 RepID=A0A2P2M4M3_RHIMU